NPADGGGDDDPTVTPLGSSPLIAITKSADTSGLLSPVQVGDAINYTFTVTNTGNVTLSGITVTDPGATVSGGPITLAPGASDTATFTASYAIQQADIDAGTYSNQATVAGNPPTGPPVNAVSDDPVTGDPSDPTIAVIPQTSELKLTKQIASVRQLFPYTYEITYRVEAINTGNTQLTGIRVTDDLAAAFQPGRMIERPTISLAGFGGSPQVNAAFDGVSDFALLSGDPTLQPGETGTVTIVARVQFARGYPQQGNIARGSSDQTPGPILSDDPTVTPGDDTDLNPTPRPVDDADGDGIPDSKESATADRDGDGIPDSDDYDPTGTFYCEETGAIQPGGLISVIGPLGTQTGAGSSNNITIVSDGTTGRFQFFVSAAGRYTLAYTLPASGTASVDRLSSGTLDLSTRAATDPIVLGAGELRSTRQLPDFSQAANTFFTVFDIEEGDPNVINNNIPLRFCGTPQLTAEKRVIGNPFLLASGSTQVTFRLSLKNDGTTRAENIELNDDLDAAFGAGQYSVTSTKLVLRNDVSNIDINGGFDGSSDVNVLTTGGSLDPGGEVVADIVVVVAPQSSGEKTNSVVGRGTSPLTGDPITSNVATAAVNIAAPAALSGLRVEKVSVRSTARIGDVVPYTVTVTNLDPLARTNVNLVDLIPVGFTYRPGSGTVDGVAQEPVQNGRRLVWGGRTVPALGSVVLKLNLGVGAGATGTEFINQAWVEDPVTGNRISTIGRAKVTREIEHVFDCGEIIGKVFDDKNQNGYQNKGEPGLPGVRIATVKGLLVTTDKKGRFHVACADLPDERIGSNFIMKLDTRTLPSGYRVTTENPRVVRLTRGKITKLNFGAAISRVVRIDLNASAFSGNSNKPVKELSHGIDKLLRKLAGAKPATLRLTYHATRSDRKLARQRLKAVRKMIDKKWRASNGRYRLPTEVRIIGGGK
ncbi:hypothetical protein ACFQ14_14410, partial [Pseudahrensia aquimaris]